MNNNVRVGESYIFGKKSGKLIKYSDIDCAHHFVRKNNYYKVNRFIEIFTFDGSRIKLCKVSGTDDNVSCCDEIINTITQKNPNVKMMKKEKNTL